MACSRTDAPEEGGEAGFATASATLISLALALLAAAGVIASVAELKRARAEYARDRVDYDLAGAHEEAALKMATEHTLNRSHWSVGAEEGTAEVLAEPEAPKLALKAAADLPPMVLDKLDVLDADAVRRRLKTMTLAEAIGPGLEAADGSAAWRACARSLISAYGASATIPRLQADAPASDLVGVHVGDVWRVRITLKGWVDDRMVRLSGVRVHPVTTLQRRFYRQEGREIECDTLFGGL